MKKILLSVAIAVSVCNITIGIGYAAVCQSTKGVRSCGTTCATNPDGTCACTGGCSVEERDWVGGAKVGGEDELL
jgi:hypothetical protein